MSVNVNVIDSYGDILTDTNIDRVKDDGWQLKFEIVDVVATTIVYIREPDLYNYDEWIELIQNKKKSLHFLENFIAIDEYALKLSISQSGKGHEFDATINIPLGLIFEKFVKAIEFANKHLLFNM